MNDTRALWYDRILTALRQGDGETVIIMHDGTVRAVTLATPEIMNGHRPVWVYQAAGTPGTAHNGDRKAWIAREAANALPASLIGVVKAVKITVNILSPEWHPFLTFMNRLLMWTWPAERKGLSVDGTLVRRVAMLATNAFAHVDVAIEQIPHGLGDHLPNTLRALNASGKVVLIEPAVRLTKPILGVDGLFVVREKRKTMEIFRTYNGELVHASPP